MLELVDSQMLQQALVIVRNHSKRGTDARAGLTVAWTLGQQRRTRRRACLAQPSSPQCRVQGARG